MKLTLIALCLGLSAWAQNKPLFEENFESGKIDESVWEKRMAGTATIQVQQDQVAHGKYALQIHYPEMATQTYAFLIDPHVPEAARSHFFGRAYVKIAPATPPSHTVLVLAGAAGWPLSKFDEIGVSRGAVQPSYQENKSARGQGRGEDVRHGDALPMDKWFLLEWEFNDNPSTLTVWVDGKLSQVTEKDKSGQPQKVDVSTFKWPAGTDNSANLVGGFEEFGVGVRAWGGATPAAFDVYYDDIALGAQRIGPVKQ
jgi:hypothetical protein